MQYLSSAICYALSCLSSFFFFFNPPSWINVVGLVLTRHRSDSALAKWHAACGTWAQEADCFLLWRKARREGRGVEDGEQSGSVQTTVSPSSSLLPDSFCSRAVGEGRVWGSCLGRKGRWDAALDASRAVCVGGSETRGPCSSVWICWRVQVGYKGEISLQQLIWLKVALSSVQSLRWFPWGGWCEGRVLTGCMFLAPVLPVSRCQACYETLGRYRRGGSEQSRQYHVDGTTGCDIKIAEVWLCLNCKGKRKE